MYDCGFFCMLFMENFNSRIMLDFDKDAIPSFRKIVAASLIDGRENEGDLSKIMDADLD